MLRASSPRRQNWCDVRNIPLSKFGSKALNHCKLVGREQRRQPQEAGFNTIILALKVGRVSAYLDGSRTLGPLEAKSAEPSGMDAPVLVSELC